MSSFHSNNTPSLMEWGYKPHVTTLFRSFSTVRNLPYLTWLFKLTSPSNFHSQSIYKAEQTSLLRAPVFNVPRYTFPRRPFYGITYITLSDTIRRHLVNNPFWIERGHYLMTICTLFSWKTSKNLGFTIKFLSNKTLFTLMLYTK